MKPDQVHIAVLAYRRGVGRELLEWLGEATACGATWGMAPEVSGVAAMRTMTCADAIAAYESRGGRRYLVMIDHDMVPCDASILTAPGQIVWLDYPGRDGSLGHVGAANLGCGCIRIDLDALVSVPLPWFRKVRDARGQIIQCDCNWFAQQARSVGVGGQCVGHAWHRLPRWEAYDDNQEVVMAFSLGLQQKLTEKIAERERQVTACPL